jgi:hypothetical protein
MFSSLWTLIVLMEDSTRSVARASSGARLATASLTRRGANIRPHNGQAQGGEGQWGVTSGEWPSYANATAGRRAVSTELILYRRLPAGVPQK